MPPKPAVYQKNPFLERTKQLLQRTGKSVVVLKKGGTRKRKPTQYNLRAAQFLSERSSAVQKSNLTRVSKKHRKQISKLLNKTRKAD